MGDTSFTCGPWAVSKQKARRVTAGGVIICNAVLRNRGGPKHKAELKDEHEAEANAALIAAAPCLFDALLACAGAIKPDDDFSRALVGKARKAIGKALGEIA